MSWSSSCMQPSPSALPRAPTPQDSALRSALLGSVKFSHTALLLTGQQPCCCCCCLQTDTQRTKD